MQIIGALLAAAGAGIVYSAVKTYRRDELITNTPTSKVRSIAVGRVELYGLALPYEKNRLKTPFGGKDCIYCSWSVESLAQDRGHNDRRYRTVKEGERAGLFYLKDDTGKVLIYSKGADVETKYQRQYDKIPTNDAYEFLASQGIDFEKILSPRLTESFIAPNENVYVLATAKTNPHKKDPTEQQEDELIVCKGDDVFYISPRPYDKIHRYAAGNISTYLLAGSAMILAGLALIFIYP
ncbi:MAG: GIDE domain-containing protein [Candidatus Altiarchaeota archaeon]